MSAASTIVDQAKEYVVGAAGALTKARALVSGDAQFFSVVPRMDELRRGLDSDTVYEKLDAMKRIVAQMCKGTSMAHFFPDVVKNIHVSSIELRKLIYLFVVYYAEECPDAALLSISAFQKDLVDPSVHARSLALRMLSSIRIPSIHPVVMVAVRKCVADPSPLVRKTAAISLHQMHHIAKDEADMESLRVMLAVLLADANVDVVGAAVMAYSEICPHDVALLHPVFRHLCVSAVTAEEWGQVGMMRVLLRYARTQFCDPTLPSHSTRKGSGDDSSVSDSDGNSSDDSSSTSSLSNFSELVAQGAAKDSTVILHPDHQLLINTSIRLLRSINSAVVISACAVLFHCAPRRYLDDCVKPLIRLLCCSSEGQSLVLHAAYTIIACRPMPFTPYIRYFYLSPRDSADVRDLKLRILTVLVMKSSSSSNGMLESGIVCGGYVASIAAAPAAGEVLRELRIHTRSFSIPTVVDATRALGLLAVRHPDLSAHIMRVVTPLLSHSDSAVVSEAVSVLRLLVVQGKSNIHTSRLVFRMMQDVIAGTVKAPSVLSTVVWLAGECISAHAAIAAAAPDCFRALVARITQLEPATRRETLTLGLKIWLHLDGSGELAERFHRLFLYAIELARYDEHYSIRDEGRALECALDRTSESFASLKKALLSEKPVPHVVDPLRGRARFEVGTFSHLLGRAVFGYEDLPRWPLVMPDPMMREPPRTQAAAVAAAGSVYSSSDLFSSGVDREDVETSESDATSSYDGHEDSIHESRDSEDDVSSGGSDSEDTSSEDSSTGSCGGGNGGAAGGRAPAAPKRAAVKIVVRRAHVDVAPIPTEQQSSEEPTQPSTDTLASSALGAPQSAESTAHESKVATTASEKEL